MGYEDKNKEDIKPQAVEQSNVRLTAEQQAIQTRVAAETDRWETIGEESMHDFSLANFPLNLKDNFPEAFKEENEKRYAFRWCERTPQRIDELTRAGHPVTRWKICTRNTTPFLSKYMDPLWGCITRLDQVMLYRPWARHMIEQNAKNQLKPGDPISKVENSAQEGVDVLSGPEHLIKGSDEVVHVDTRKDSLSDLIVDH